MRCLATCLLLLVLVLGVACTAPAAPQSAEPSASQVPITAEASVDRAVATTGDLITYTLSVEHDASIAVEFPDLGDEIADLRIVEQSFEGPEPRGERVFESRSYKLRADLVSSYVLPPVTIAYRSLEEEAPTGGSIETSALFIEVSSVLPEEGGADDIREIKSLQPAPSQLPWKWIAAGLAAALLVALGVWLWRRHRRRERPVPPPAPAHEIALRALEELRAAGLDDSAAVRRFHFAISEVVRTYVEGRWGLNATDLTSEEIIASLSTLRGLEHEQAMSLRRFLLDTDRVKFADHEPNGEQIEETFERARGFVEATRPVPEPETPVAEDSMTENPVSESSASEKTASAKTVSEPEDDEEPAA